MEYYEPPPDPIQERFKQLVELSRGTEYCGCCCLHDNKIYEDLSPWRGERCSPDSDSREEIVGVKGTREDTASSKTHLNSKTKRRNSVTLYSKSLPSLSPNEVYDVRGTEICRLDPSEQASYYRVHVTQEASKKLGYIYPRFARRKLKEQASISPQVTSQSHGLRIVPVQSKSYSLTDSKKLRVTMEQSIRRPPGGRVNSFLELDFKGRWARSLCNYKLNALPGPTPSQEVVTVKGNYRQMQQRHRAVSISAHQSEARNHLVCTDCEEDSNSTHCLLETRADLSAPLQCFPLGSASHKKQESRKSSSTTRHKSLRNSKGPSSSWKAVPPLVSTSSVVLKPGQPTSLLQHHYSVRFGQGLQGGFRYETLSLRGRGGSDSTVTVTGPWISPPQ